MQNTVRSKIDGVNIIETIAGIDISPATIISIDDMSYSSNLYTVKFRYINVGQQSAFEVDYNSANMKEATLYFKLNTDKRYSKFNIVKYVENKSEKDSKEENVNNSKQDLNEINEKRNNEITENNVTSIIDNTLNTIGNNETNNSSNTITTNTTNVNKKENTGENGGFIVDWTNYWAPGVKFDYPSDFTMKKIETQNQGYLTTEITGTVKGKRWDNSEAAESNLKIKVFHPSFVNENTMNALMYSEDGLERGNIVNNNGIKWFCVSTRGEEKGYEYSEIYSSFERTTEGGICMCQFEFVTNNSDNNNVRNIINRVIGSAKLTSW